MMASNMIASFVAAEPVTLGVAGAELINPATGSLIGVVAEAGEEGVTAAVVSALSASRNQAKSSHGERAKLLLDAADALAAAAAEIAAIICEDVGKPLRVCQVEVKRGVEFLRGTAAILGQASGEVLPVDLAAAGQGTFGFTLRVPYGIVAAITPFNAPVNLLVQKVAPAVAAGNAVIAKPHPSGLRTALRLAAIFVEAGWPSGLLNVLSGDRPTAAALVAHPDVSAVSFTGSTAGGAALAKIAGAKKFVAELGSNAANIVFDDADLKSAAKKIAAASFEASGQQCISAQRVIVHRSVLPAFTELFAAASRELKVGHPAEASTDVGTMVSLQAAERVMAMVQNAADQGATLVLAPKREGATVSPGILTNVPKPARLWQEEVFGPIAVIVGFDTDDEALDLANDSPFGLQGAAFTSNLARAFRLAREFEVGSLWINEASRFRLDMYPFGGVKQSGVGREGLKYAVEEMSQVKFIGIRP